MSAVTLNAEQEQEALALAARIRAAVDNDILELARLLVSKSEAETFGQTEFQVRDLVHGLGAKAMQTHLAEKKTATAAPASSVPSAARPRASRTTGPSSR